MSLSDKLSNDPLFKPNYNRLVAPTYGQLIGVDNGKKAYEERFPLPREVVSLAQEYFEVIRGYFEERHERFTDYRMNSLSSRLWGVVNSSGKVGTVRNAVIAIHWKTYGEIQDLDRIFQSKPIFFSRAEHALTRDEISTITAQYKDLRKRVSALIKEENASINQLFQQHINQNRSSYSDPQLKELRSIVKETFTIKDLSKDLHRIFSHQRNGKPKIWKGKYKKRIPFLYGKEGCESIAYLKSLNRGLTSFTIRNEESRGKEGAELINFHRSEYDFVRDGQSDLIAFSATRSGSLSEIDERDPDKRRAANITMAEELLSHKALEATQFLSKSDWKNNNRRNPLKLDFQSVSLLSYFPKSVRGQRFEYQQFEDQKQALEFFDGRAVEYHLPESNKTIWVKFDIRVWNLGASEDAFGRVTLDESGNRMKIPGWQMLQNWFQDSHNDKAMKKLRDKYNNCLQDLSLLKDRKKKEVTTLPAAVQSDYTRLKKLRNEKEALRKKICSREQTNTYIKKALSIVSWIPLLGNALERGVDALRNKYTGQLYQQYCDKADEMVGIFNTYDSRYEIFAIERKEEDIRDLFYDVEELYGAKAYHYLWQMRDDRYALSSALTLLSFKMSEVVVGKKRSQEVTPHFNCKSGCDRTAGLDIACKRKVELSRCYGRFISYREQPDQDIEDEIGTQLRLHSGNYDYISKKRFGARGLKSANCRGIRHSNPNIEDRLYRIERGCTPIFGL